MNLDVGLSHGKGMHDPGSNKKAFPTLPAVRDADLMREKS